MITPHFVRLMAQYNQWQNQSLYGAADTLTDVERHADRGAFFGSLHTTLAHILWADRVWMSRFADTPPTALEDDQGKGPAYLDWDQLKRDRIAFDALIRDWAGSVTEAWLEADFTWSNVAGTVTATQPAWRLVAHFLNHQTHHRGQAHALLTSFGATPTDTDLFLMPGAN